MKKKKVIPKKRKLYIKQKLNPSEVVFKGDIPLNINNSDRISFSLREDHAISTITKIENISYEVFINEQWEWVIRYDDHGGKGLLHRHERISLEDEKEIVVQEWIRKRGTKISWRNWAFKDIKKNYLKYRSRFMKNCNLDLY